MAISFIRKTKSHLHYLEVRRSRCSTLLYVAIKNVGGIVRERCPGGIYPEGECPTPLLAIQSCEIIGLPATHYSWPSFAVRPSTGWTSPTASSLDCACRYTSASTACSRIPRRAVPASLWYRRSSAPAVSSSRPVGRTSSRAVDIWKTCIQLRRPLRLERSSWLSEEQHFFSVCLQTSA